MAEKKYEYVCSRCGTSEWLPRWRHKQKKYPDLCKSCAQAKGHERYKNIRTTDPDKWKELTEIKRRAAKNKHRKSSKKERIEHAKKMRAAVTISGTEMRQKQQDFIDSAGEDYYINYCNTRRRIALEFHANMSDEEKEIHYRKVLKNNGRSKECDDFLDTLKNHGIDCIEEQYIKGFIVDGIIRNTNLIIEYYGDVFHCNPKRFKDPNQKCSWLSGRTVQEQWNRDKRRLAALYRYGYKVIIVWGEDWKSAPDKIIERILNEMHIS